jgi:hypothetical protein
VGVITGDGMSNGEGGASAGLSRRGAIARARGLAGAARRWARARIMVRREKLRRTTIGQAVLFYPSSSIIGESVASGAGWEPTLANTFAALVQDDEAVVAEVRSNMGSAWRR